jgi:alpha,alpha-trehalase
LPGRWTEPDDGIWEVRGGRRHFVASKVMAWVAVDRAIRLARGLGLPADLDRWSALASAIRRQVEQAGVDPASGAFTQAFGSRAPDAANLLLPLVRFLPPDDPRIRATVERTARELAPQGLVHRYLGADDGLPGGEASFGSAASGWSTTSPSPARPTGPPCCSSGCSATPTTWGCWPRRSTRPAATCSATSPRPSVTSR